MKKIYLLAILLCFVSVPVIASFGPPTANSCPTGQVYDDCSGTQVGPAQCVPGCRPVHVIPPTGTFVEADRAVIPYFTTRAGWHTRLGVINPTEYSVAITVNLHNVSGQFIGSNSYVLEPFANFVAAIRATNDPRFPTMIWAPEQSTPCSLIENPKFNVDEGYVTITSKAFPVFGPGGFCANDYLTDYNMNALRYEFTIWEPGRLRNEYREMPIAFRNPHTSWTKNVDRATSWIVTFKNKPGRGCFNAFSIVANRQGDFETFTYDNDGIKLGKQVPLCNMVNVIQFGGGILDSNASVDVEKYIPILKTPEFNAGWMQFFDIETYNMTLRSTY